MTRYGDLSIEQLKQLERDPGIGDVAKANIAAELLQREHGGSVHRVANKTASGEQKPLPPLLEPLTIVVPWSSLASDNLRKGIAGADNREKQARYAIALERFRSIVREHHGDVPYAGPVQLTALFWFPDNRPRDPWNFTKGILDGLKGLALVDDKWQELRRVTFEAGGIDVDRPRCELTIQPFGA